MVTGFLLGVVKIFWKQGVKKREPSYTVAGYVNWCRHHGEHYGGFLEKLKTELPYDPTILPLCIYPKKVKTLFEKIHAP